MDYNFKVLQHISDFWMGYEITGFTWNHGRILNELPSFHVFRISPKKGNEPWIYISSGIGEIIGKEFVISSPVETHEHIETLVMLASACFNKVVDAHIGKVINIGRPWLEGSQFSNLLISLPYPYGRKLEIMDAIQFLWLLPISDKEKEFLYPHSLDELETLFDEYGIDYLNPNRKSVI